MARRSVEIVITAEDQASGKMVNAARNIENTNKKIVETGKKSKAANEALAQFVGLFGGGQLAGASGALTAIGDKFGEIEGDIEGAKIQALAFKAVIATGIAGAVIAVGRLIAEQFIDQLDVAQRKADRLNQALQQDADARRSAELERISQIADEEERRLAARKELANIAGRQSREQQTLEDIEKQLRLLELDPRLGRQRFFTNLGGMLTGSREAMIEQLEAQREAAEEAISAQQAAVVELTQLAEGKHQSDLERIEERRKAEREAHEEALKQLEEQVKANLKAAQERQREQERAAAALDRRESTALGRMRAIDNQLDGRMDRQPQGSNPALEARLLSRVRTDDKTIEREQLAELKAQKELLKLQLERMKDERQRNNTLEVELVS